MMPTAVLIDGAYFLRRFSSSFPTLSAENPKAVALGVVAMAAYHVAVRLGPTQTLAAIDGVKFRPEESPHLYRIFFYDCAPLTKKVHLPVSKRSLDLSKTPQAISRLAIHRELHGVRKVALRLGRLNDKFDWQLKADARKRMISSQNGFHPSDDDFELDVTQKGVDMRFGIDIASLAFKRQVDQIIMVAGDADFVPAAKLARREGIDVVLDPMWGSPAHDLLEHVDGVRNCRVTLAMPEETER
jgi:uncharacterized LabA/DUF88 family protein